MLRRIDRAAEAAAAFCMAVSAAMICANVFYRYVVLSWMRAAAEDAPWFSPVADFFADWLASVGAIAGEVPGYLLVWISFVGAYLAHRRNEHIGVDFLSALLPAAAEKARRNAVRFLLLALFAVLFAQSARMIWVDGETEIETADIAQGWFMLVLPASALLLAAATAAQFWSGEKRRES